MSFHVNVQPSGCQFSAEAGENLIDAALRQGLVLPYGCRNGSCGRCRGKLLAGEVDWHAHETSLLSPQERALGYVLFCSIRPRSNLTVEAQEVRVTTDIPVRKLRVKVDSVEALAHDVVRLYLKLPATQRLQYLAGQYLDFLLSDGRRRSFSIANSPRPGQCIELHVRHVDGGAFSGQLFDGIREKSLLQIEAPFGQFYLRDSDRPILLVAGGTGFAPIKAILEHAFSAGVRRPLRLYWGARALRDLYLDALPRHWLQQYPQFDYIPVLSQPDSADHWHGRAGLVHDAVAADYDDFSGFDVYAAGPPPMVRALHDTLLSKRLPPKQFFSDPFEYARK